MGKRKAHPHHETLTVRAVPVPVSAHHPPIPKGLGILPDHEFTMGLVAPKGSGKTTLLVNILDYYQGYFHAIHIFSPTLMSDEKWDYVRRRPLLGENKALKKFLEKHNQDTNSIVGKPTAIAGSDTHFDPHIPDDHFRTEYDERTLVDIVHDIQTMHGRIQELGGTKHVCDRILFIFDDLVGSKLFSNRRQSAFKMLNTIHRHRSASMIMVTQAYRELPKTVRTNLTCVVTFEIPSEAELKAVYEEYPCGMKRDVWEQVHRYCVNGEYAFMYINTKRPKRLRIMRNFEQFVFMESSAE